MVYEEDLMRERIHVLMHREGLSQLEFANKIGRAQSNVSQIMRGERHIPRGFASDIIKAFPGIRKDWLLLGDGSMFVDGEEPDAEIPKGTRPRLPRTLTDSHLSEYFEGEKRSLCQEEPIIKQFPDYDFSMFLKTDRMAPNYRMGDELFFKRIISIKEWGNCYLLDTKEGPKFKKVFEEEDTYKCVSYNRDEYPDFTIPKDIVYGFYECVGILRIL